MRLLLFPFMIAAAILAAASPKPVWTGSEKPLVDQIKTLRDVPDERRGEVTVQLAKHIRSLPAAPNKLLLAKGLANLSTEGDFGQNALQEVATTLASALSEEPGIATPDQYSELAQLVRYEHVHVSLHAPAFTTANQELDADEKARQSADFTLTDLEGKPWTLSQLHGKVVLVNFWATWCPPCRMEMPDLDALYTRFKNQGLIILAISDEESAKVTTFLSDHHVSYPVLLDPDRKVNDRLRVQGIPKTFIFDRQGHLAAQSMDMRTQGQFLKMLAQAGL